MDNMLSVENMMALLSLTGLELVLGFDNIVVITLLVNKLEKEKRDFARKLGLFCAMFMRIGLLFSISFIMQLKTPLFQVLNHGITGRDIVLLLGGLFLIGKATFEIHENIEGPEDAVEKEMKKVKGFFSVIIQILLIDLVFSLDSVITAVGMAAHLAIMVVAVVLSVILMMYCAKGIGHFIEKHPTFKILALSFLVLVGVMLVAEGLGTHIEKGYIYFAMGFSLMVEFINLRIKKGKSRT